MKNNRILILKLIVFTIIFSIFTFLIGVFLGANFFTELEVFGRRGYEAGGNIGFLLGIILGITISAIYFSRNFNKSGRNF